MILVAHPSKPFQFNAKCMPLRGIILEDYVDEIEALYTEVESGTQSECAPPTVWNSTSILAFVRTVVQSTLRRAIADDAYIFHNGGDSLQAAWIWNTLLRALGGKDKGAMARLTMNTVFQASTITSLATLVHRVVQETNSEETARTPQDLWKHVERHKWGR